MGGWLQDWIHRLSEPRPEFSGYSACPYAKAARIAHLQPGSVPEARRTLGEINGLSPKTVLVFELPRASAGQAHQMVKEINPSLARHDMIALVSDPSRPIVVDGFQTTQPDRLLIILQKLSELRSYAVTLDQGGYYARWSDKDRQRIAR